MKKTINRNDWSGEEITYQLIGNKIKVNDTPFEMVEKETEGEKYIVVYDRTNNSRFLTLVYFGGLWHGDNCGVEREGKNPDEVVVEIYCNTY